MALTNLTPEPDATPLMSGGAAVVAALLRWNVDTIFGVPGVQLDALFDALHGQTGAINVVHARHEQGAAYMAFGYAAATGKIGVCTVVPGPGVLNAGAALATAYACNAPVLCITSTVNSAQIGKGNGALHEIPDQTGLLRGLTKWYARANNAAEIPALMDEAFRQLLTGRPRPVAIEVPPDILAEILPVRAPEQLPSLTTPAVDLRKIAQAADLLAGAQTPMIVVGSGALRAGAEVQALAELLQAPVVARNMGRGIVSERHDLSLQAATGMPLWKDVDVVIGIGTRLQQLREWGNDARLKVVRIDLDRSEITRIAPPAVAIIADAADATGLLVQELRRRQLKRPSRVLEFRALKAKFRAELETTLAPQLAFVDAIRGAMGDDDVLVDEMTQVGYAAKFAFPILAPFTYVNSSYQGTLGYGFATALGAQVGNPNRRVVSINGDGGFLYTMPELASAVLHKIKLVAIVFNDGNFGNVRRIQKTAYGGRLIASHLHNPDFMALAAAFSVRGARANDAAALGPVLREALAFDGPTLIEVPMDIDAMPSPWHHVHPRLMRP